MLIWEKRRTFTPDEEDLAWLCVITITVHFYSDNFIPGWSESNWQSSHTHNSPWDSKKNLPYATGHNKSFSWSDPTTHALGSFYVFRQLYVLPYMTFGSSKNNFFDGNDKVGDNSSEKIAIFRFPGNLILSRFCNILPQTFWVQPAIF